MHIFGVENWHINIQCHEVPRHSVKLVKKPDHCRALYASYLLCVDDQRNTKNEQRSFDFLQQRKINPDDC
ncbi:hypothetical protein K7X08_029812 [Anisodus acutangulus]|uniref:Uncharacterized protein n=1 Tax=Anisodus acutangulus TaxID=402998 RepID=A0A9Q1MC05_9SOLA|nr:hypothetical protein K7X08_029812 [Anisodus acutangulus]